jgi:hypothetical protein
MSTGYFNQPGSRATGTLRLTTVVVALLAGLTWPVATQEGSIVAGPAPVRENAVQYDFSGGWVPIIHEDGNNRAVGGEYEITAGLPLNEAARMRYEAYSEDQTSLLEFQCRRFITPYSTRTAHAILWITTELEPTTQRVAAFRLNYQHNGTLLGGTRTIYLDGRAHPSSLEPHSFGGFSTGRWDGNMLNVELTHLKSYYTNRPGIPASDERTVSEHWVRHGDLLTMTMEITDPVFFTEPLVWSVTWAKTNGPQPPAEESFCHASPELPSVSGQRHVPFYLPGTNPAIREVMANYGVPEEAMRGRAEMMYPEYRKQMTQPASSLAVCKRRCTN